MSKRKIRDALEYRLNEFATTEGIPVIWENISAVPPTDYLKADLIPGRTRDPSIGALHRRYLGTFRVMYYTDNLNQGMQQIEEMISRLVDHFPRALQLTKDDVVVHIENTPTEVPPLHVEGWLVMPVEIYYRADVIKT